VRWFLSINYDTIPDAIKTSGARTFRSITIEGEELEFSGGFTDLHTRSYENILEGNGFSIGETRQSIEIVHDIRHKEPLGLKGEYHPFAKLPFSSHPFSK
jgi:UDP-N-acetyl-2-amino-2-deoxyglucuronate dehydrogenase